MEIAINALRDVVNHEDKCDQAIKSALEKGPKRVRIASREELKMEINKYKNISLRLVDEMKRSGHKVPSHASKSNLSNKETGLRVEKEEAGAGLNATRDHLDAVSVGQGSNPEMMTGAGGLVGLDDSGVATPE